jgi:hypothetical protein
MKPSNYPIKSVDEVLSKYNINGKYYDFSCGWGVRLLSAMRNRVEYYGTDPNNLLVDRLRQIATDYNTVNGTSASYDIRCHGSETFVPEWENTIGVAFSSPPYFNLEDYGVGNQSYKPGTSYQEWLDNYLRPTIENIKRYLVDDGKMLVNIKDFLDYKLCADTRAIAESLGFHYVETLTLKNITRPSAKVDLNTDEGIMVFSKKPEQPIPSPLSLFSFG